MKKKLICVLMLVALFTTTASAAAVQAQTAPHFKVIIDGVTQSFKDANGNQVEPVTINGVTYLPLRSVADAFGKEVGWDSATSTITIGTGANASKPAEVEKGPVKLIDVLSAKANKNSLYVTKVNGEASLTFENLGKFQSAVKLSDINSAKKSGSFELSGTYSSMSCSLLFVSSKANAKDKATIQISNADTGVDVVNQELELNKLVRVDDVDITGLKNMEFSGKSQPGDSGILYVLDPVLK